MLSLFWSCVLVRVLQRDRTNDTYKELACMIMEAEKSHDLPCVSWKPRTGGGVVQSESKGLRTRRAKGINSSPQAADVPAQAVRYKESQFSLPSPFCSIQANRLDDAHCGGQSALLRLLVQSSPYLETLSQTCPEIVFNLGISWPNQVDT